MVTIYDMVTELQTWFTISPEILDEANESDINDSNNKKFKKLVCDWNLGKYDNDPETFYASILSFLQ